MYISKTDGSLLSNYFYCVQMSNDLTECFGDFILSYLKTVFSPAAAPKTTTGCTSQPCQTLCVDEEIVDTKTNTSSVLRTRLRKLFHHHLLQLRCNSHFVSVLTSERAQRSTEVASSQSVETTTEMRLGSAIYPTASLMNHSCAPNAIFR